MTMTGPVDGLDAGSVEDLRRHGRDDIIDALDSAIRAAKADWISQAKQDRAGTVDGTTLGEQIDWRLGSLRQAGEQLLAGVEVSVALTGDEPGQESVTIMGVAVLGRANGSAWEVKLCEVLPRRRLGPRFDAAYAYAAAHHADDTRKGTQIPYLAHLLAVASLVLEMQSDSEDEAIAALLHDVVEDDGGMRAAGEIVRRFGPTCCGSCWPTAIRRRAQAAVARAQGEIRRRASAQGAR